MKVKRAELARGLRLASGIADRKSAMPIMASVLMSARAGKLSIAATDTVVSLTAEIACDDALDPVAFNAADLSRFVAGASGDDLTIQVAKAHHAEIKCGRAKYKIAGVAGRDFPKIHGPSTDLVAVDAAALRDLLVRASYAAATEEAHGPRCGVLLETGPEQCRGVTLHGNGHRAVMVRRKITMPRAPGGSAILAARGAKEFTRLLEGAETCQVAIDSKRMHVRCGDIAVSAALLEGTFPPIDMVTPTEHKACVVANRDRLVESIKRVAPLTAELRGMSITARDGVVALVARREGGTEELSDEIEAETSGVLEFSCQPKYLLECLSHMSGDAAELRWLGGTAPLLLLDHGDAGYTGLVMGMRP